MSFMTQKDIHTSTVPWLSCKHTTSAQNGRKGDLELGSEIRAA
jgi:hypothetical protein